MWKIKNSKGKTVRKFKSSGEMQNAWYELSCRGKIGRGWYIESTIRDKIKEAFGGKVPKCIKIGRS